LATELGEPFLFILGALAAWRLTALLAYERGPAGIFDLFRRSMVRMKLGRLVGCFHCLGIWVTAGVTLILFGLELTTILIWLAMAGAISIVERWLVGGEMTEKSND
jgi:predicted acyltransferase